MPQPPLLDLSALIVKDRDLLKPRMKITTYNQHDVGSFSSLGLFLANQSTRTCEPTSLCNQAEVCRGRRPSGAKDLLSLPVRLVPDAPILRLHHGEPHEGALRRRHQQYLE